MYKTYSTTDTEWMVKFHWIIWVLGCSQFLLKPDTDSKHIENTKGFRGKSITVSGVTNPMMGDVRDRSYSNDN